jgi:hypothetical protein
VEAFQSMERNGKKYDPMKKSKYKKGYDRTKSPWESCDIIRTALSKEKISPINIPHWENFKLGCEKHVEAFKELNEKVHEGSAGRMQWLRWQDMKEYYEKSRNPKRNALKYKRITIFCRYELVNTKV